MSFWTTTPIGPNTFSPFANELRMRSVTWRRPLSTLAALPFPIWQQSLSSTSMWSWHRKRCSPRPSSASRAWGYIHRGNLGIPEREAFLAPAHDPPHHLYVCPPGSAEFRRHMAFRDYLRAHPKDARIYGDLKIALAERFREDRSAYSTAMGEFVAELTSRAMRYSEELIR